ncbi:hypothetical protein I8748_11710 [Nostoc sp. CENA67]|uniref:Uncharacterized protein n=1 Tax=Amazonocrinis nigriterrae CENA67 TaxID=2794033 RepID=A0A8J7L7Z7_9NOST|nr:hypothetical protein [Amazonocrinis nigriterrae]MBH8562838.1 hypothetical protein [Amazonocrinis nigriterrae CENA67]
MSISYIVIDDFLTDNEVKKDLINTIWEDKSECLLELEQKTIIVPRNTLLEVVSKSYRQNNYQIGFGNYYAAQIAIGGVKELNSGILYPVYCFATIFYTFDKKLITVDIHLEMR